MTIEREEEEEEYQTSKGHVPLPSRLHGNQKRQKDDEIISKGRVRSSFRKQADNFVLPQTYRKVLALKIRPNNRISVKLTSACCRLLCLLSLLLISEFSSKLPILLVRSQQMYYYATLPKLVGHIRGIRMETTTSFPLNTQNNINYNLPQPVVAFLGIPYAAPPTGLLRFMPPGATSHTNQRTPEQCQLMPSGQRAAVRPHAHFGRQCAHLADWLPEVEKDTLVKAETNNSGGKQQNTINNETQLVSSSVRFRQSEDCLNLNAFVPINESSAPNQNNNNNNKSFRQQIKSNNPSSSSQQNYSSGQTTITSNRTTDNQQAHSDDQGTLNKQRSNPLLWPLPKLDQRLPVSVIFHGTTNGRQNSFNYLELAHRTNSLVVTFNYRLGLLGFLPYSMNDQSSSSSYSSSSSSSSASAFSSSARWLPRNNHAIWDQIGLLHWLRRNIAHLNGNPNNVTLVAADNQAYELVQLLIMSPLAKGLFNRVVLVYDDNELGEFSHNNEFGQTKTIQKLLVKVNESRDLRRRLSSALNRIVQQMVPEVAVDEQKALEFVQAASLEQLAKVEQQLRQLHSANLLALATEPALDDRLLFPQLNALAAHQINAQNSLEFMEAELRYCHYMRQLYANKPDSLNLLPFAAITTSGEWQQVKEQQTGSWHRDLNATRSSQTSNSVVRSTIVMNFEHFYKLQLLAKLLGLADSDQNPEVGQQLRKLAELDEEEEDDFSELSRRQQGRTVLAAHGAATLRRRQVEVPNDNKQVSSAKSVKRSANNLNNDVDENLSQLLELLASFDLMVGHLTKQTTNESSETSKLNNFDTMRTISKNFANISNALTRNWSYHYFKSEQLILQLNLVELHHVSSLLVPFDSTAQYCDLILPTPTAHKSSFVFVAPSTGQRRELSPTDDLKQKSDWLIDTANQQLTSSMVDGLTSFIHFGDPNRKSSQTDSRQNYWPLYDSLNRRIKRIPVFSEQSVSNVSTIESNKLSIGLHLDLIPYFNQLQPQTNATIWLSDNFSGEKSDLIACLKSIDEIIGTSPNTSQYLMQPEVNQQTPILNAAQESKSQCLLDSIARFKVLLRQNANDDLEPLIKLRSYRLPTQQTANSTQRAAISTRNLLSTDSADLQQLDQPSSNMDSSLSKQMSGTTTTTTTFNGNKNQVFSGSRRQESMVNVGFFGKLYRDAAGQALALVIGCGLLVFFVNLAIVVIITLRASRTRRRVGETKQQNNDDETEFSNSMSSQQGAKEKQLSSQVNGTNKRSSLKRYQTPTSSRLESLNKVAENSRSGSLKAKQLKFDLSGIERAKLTTNETETEVKQELELTSGELSNSAGVNHNSQVIFEPHHCFHEQQQQQQPMMYVPETDHQCLDDETMRQANNNNNLILAAGTTSIYGDYIGDEHLSASQVSGGCQQSQQVVDQETLEQLQADKLASLSWPQDDLEPIYLNHQNNDNNNNNQFHLHQQPAFEQLQQQHCRNGGSLNSPAFGSQSTTTSTTNGNLYSRNDLHHKPQQHHRYFVTQTSPDTSATLSVTPIRLESFVNTLQLGSNDQHQDQQFQLIEPIGLLYPSNFESELNYRPDNSDQLLGSDKVYMVAHNGVSGGAGGSGSIQRKNQQRKQQVGTFCARHQRL